MGVVAVNRELATLRRILHIAHDWEVIKGVPKVRLLPGEQSRDFVLDSTLRLCEALALQWPDVHLEHAGGARYCWVQVRDGKTKKARRTVPLAAHEGRLLAEKRQAATTAWVFPGDSSDKPVLGTSLAHMHTKVCRPGHGKKRRYIFPRDFVLHSLRHTCLTRLGEAGADAFTMMKLAGHASVTISQRFDRLETLNRRARRTPSGKSRCIFLDPEIFSRRTNNMLLAEEPGL